MLSFGGGAVKDSETGGVDEATARDVPFLVTMIAILKVGGEGRGGVVGARRRRHT